MSPTCFILTAIPVQSHALAGWLFLLASIASSVIIALLLKYNELRGGSRLTLVAANYLVATSASAISWAAAGSSPDPVTLLTGAGGGVFFIGTFLLMTAAVGRVGIGIPVAVTRLSVVLPVAVSIIFYAENPGWQHLLGFLCALTALAFFARSAIRHHGFATPGKTGGHYLLVLLFLSMGMCETVLKIFNERPVAPQKAAFMTVIFGTALVIGWTIILLQKVKVRRRDLLLGLLLGVPNVLSTYFMLGALHHLPGMVVFPVNALAIMLITTITGILIWKEDASMPIRLAVGFALAAILFINQTADLLRLWFSSR